MARCAKSGWTGANILKMQVACGWDTRLADGKETRWPSIRSVSSMRPGSTPLGRRTVTSLHVVERFWRTGPNSLQLDISFDDPKTFTAPFTGKLIFEARPGRELQPVLTCEDKILADNPADAWPFFVGEYPKINVPETLPVLKKIGRAS